MTAIKNHRNQRGGALLYVIIPVVLMGAAAGLLIAFKDSEAVKPIKEKLRPALSKIGLMAASSAEGAGAAAEIGSATAGERLTLLELYDDPNRPAHDTLDQIRKDKLQLGDRQRDLSDRERRLLEDNARLRQNEKDLQAMIAKSQEAYKTLQSADQERQAYLASQRVQRIRDMSATILKQQPKNAASLLSEIWKSTDESEKIIVVEVLRTLPGNKKSGLMDALTKSDPKSASEIMVQLIVEPENDPGTGTTSAQTP